ncbi:Retrotransposon gag protein [Gossypium australe]|uniref:Retrotransposon gag protein n=1 Tax=Gossypium australe TaxID=47621 RepID=A0A5B6X2N1_9ROSI|nr:Retrotransposon gag protein [Gossypium australe]
MLAEIIEAYSDRAESSIVRLTITTTNFKLKLNIIQMKFVTHSRLMVFPMMPYTYGKKVVEFTSPLSITTWDQMTEKFLLKYFPPAKTTKLRNNIFPFAQIECPHHGLPLRLQVQTFYNSLNSLTRQLIDVATSGTLNNKTLEAAEEFIEEMALNNYKFLVMRTKLIKAASIFKIDAVAMLASQVEALGKKIDGLSCNNKMNLVIQCDAIGVG